MTPDFPVKILFVGDMHLGRRASRIPDDIGAGGGPTPEDLAPLITLQRTVDLACAEKVQAVAFAGDLVHAENNLFEARAQLEAGLAPLLEAGLKIVAVAGNHDTHIMPLLADSIAGLHLLGRNGTWSSADITPQVRLAGWSFPAPHHRDSPLLQTPPAPQTGVVTIGLLHADLDVAKSRYAPVNSGQLQNLGYDGWALGHIHAPDATPTPENPARPFYLGSIGAVPPTETGAHGPVLATVGANGSIQWERRIIAPLRWEHVELSVDELALGNPDSPDGPHSLVADPVAVLRRHLYTFAETCLPPIDPQYPLLALGLRLTLTGTHVAAHVLQEAVRKLQSQAMVSKIDGCWIFIDKITADFNLPLDLQDLAGRQDPPGLLARRILALEMNDPAADDLVRQARRQFDEVSLPREFAESQATDQMARKYLIRAGRQALNALLDQSAEGSA
ncbi:MAG: metallophosphoesterase [Candidatus Krumholzibacteria bacterium]|nr:metallophosphoesterase [Candidatus Krumholzibacteria bacterium]